MCQGAPKKLAYRVIDVLMQRYIYSWVCNGTWKNNRFTVLPNPDGLIILICENFLVWKQWTTMIAINNEWLHDTTNTIGMELH